MPTTTDNNGGYSRSYRWQENMCLLSGAPLQVMAWKLTFPEMPVPWHSVIPDDVMKVLGGRRNVLELSRPGSEGNEGRVPTNQQILVGIQLQDMVNPYLCAFPVAAIMAPPPPPWTRDDFRICLGRSASNYRPDHCTTRFAIGIDSPCRLDRSEAKSVAG